MSCKKDCCSGVSAPPLPDSIPLRAFTDEALVNWRTEIFDIYRRMRARECPYEISYGAIRLTVLSNVYAPNFFTDSFWFAREVPKIVGHGSFLEIGTGSGIIAVAVAANGASRVVATDINSDAVVNADMNAQNNGISISVREGSLYEPLHSDERFDFIFWAHPFNNWDTPVEDELLKSGLDYKYEAVRGYIAEAMRHMYPQGRLLLGTGDSADLLAISDIAREHKYRLKILKRETLPLEAGGQSSIEYLILEFCRCQENL